MDNRRRNMKEFYKEFSEVNGEYVEGISGQDRFGFGLSDMDDFFEIEDIIKLDGCLLYTSDAADDCCRV